MSVQGIIFDVDGTILDSMSLWSNLASRYLISLGYVPESDLDNQVSKMSIDQAIHHMKTQYDINLTNQQISDGLDSFIETYYKYRLELKPNVKGLLDFLKQKQIKMCIATATQKSMIQAAFKRLEILDYFSEIFTCSQVGQGKTNPLIYIKAREHLGSEKEKTIVIEDAAYAAKTAKLDGFKVVGVFDEYEKGQEDLKSCCDLYLKDFFNIDSFWSFASSL